MNYWIAFENNSDGGDSVIKSFRDGVVLSLFENLVCPIATVNSAENPVLVNRFMASLYLKLFLFANIESKAIKFEVDDPVSIAAWCQSSSIPIIGHIILWFLSVDAIDVSVSDLAMYILCEVHQRTNPKVKGTEVIRSTFLKQCLEQLSHTLQIVSIVERGDLSERNNLLASCVKQLSDGAVDGICYSVSNHTAHLPLLLQRVKRFVNLMRLFLERQQLFPKQLCLITATPSAKNSTSNFQFLVPFESTVSIVRNVVSNHFHVDGDSISLYRSAPAGKDPIKLDKENVTLKSLKFGTRETIHIRKIENVSVASEGAVSDNKLPANDAWLLNLGVVKRKDVIFPSDLTSNNRMCKLVESSPPNPFEWLGIDVTNSLIMLHDRNVEDVLSLNDIKVDFFTPMFSLPSSPFGDHPDMSLMVGGESVWGKMSVSSMKADKGTTIRECLAAYLKLKPQYYEQLFSVLDKPSESIGSVEGTSSSSSNDIATDIWEIIQSLPPHALLLQDIQALSSSSIDEVSMNESETYFQLMFNINQPHKLLYTLQIVDNIIVNDVNEITGTVMGLCRPVLEWCWKFIRMGGVEYLFHILSQLMEMLLGHNRVKASDWGIQTGHKLTLKVVYSLSCAMLFRILHKLLLLDSKYSTWQIDLQKTYCIFPGEADNVVPPGRLLDGIDIQNTLTTIMNTTLHITKQIFSSGNLSDCSSSPCITALHSFLEHSVVLLHSIIIAADNCTALDVIASYSHFTKYLRSITMRIPVQFIRKSVCRRLLEMFTLLIVKCTENQFGVSEQSVNDRVVTFMYLFHALVSGTHFRHDSVEHVVLSEKSLNIAIECSNGTELHYLLSGVYILCSCASTLCQIGLSSIAKAQSAFNSKVANSLIVLQKYAFHKIGEDCLIYIFVKELFLHQSAESFHSSDIEDFTLIGTPCC
jgi:hypothetical protein